MPHTVTDAPEGATTTEVSFTDGLRRLADLLDERDHVSAWDEYRHLLPVYSRDAMVALVRKLGGQWEKTTTGDGTYFELTRDLGGGVSIQVYAPREKVCERVVVGTRTVLRPATAEEAPTIEVPMVEVEEEIVEWQCEPSILARADR